MTDFRCRVFNVGKDDRQVTTLTRGLHSVLCRRPHSGMADTPPLCVRVHGVVMEWLMGEGVILTKPPAEHRLS